MMGVKSSPNKLEDKLFFVGVVRGLASIEARRKPKREFGLLEKVLTVKFRADFWHN